MLACKVARTIADSTNATKNAEVCAIADTTNETIKVPSNAYAEVRVILAALPTLAAAVLIAQDHLREKAVLQFTRALSATTSHRIRISPRKSAQAAHINAAKQHRALALPSTAPWGLMKKKRIGRATRSGGAGRHHGRPPDSHGGPYKIQPKPGAIPV